MRKHLLVAGLALSLASACGQVVAPTAAGGAPTEPCTSDGNVDRDMATFSDSVLRPAAWADVQSIAPMEERDGTVSAALTFKASRRNETPPRSVLTMPSRTARILQDETESGGEVLTALTRGGDGQLHFALAVVDRDGIPTFVGNCMNRLTLALGAFAKGRGSTPRGALESIAAGESATRGALASDAAPAELSWAQMPASSRQYVDGQTPASVLSRLQQVQVNLEIPMAWLSFAGRLCPRTSEAWSTCANFDAETPRGTVGGGPLSFYSYKRPSEPVELWIIDQAAGIQRPLGKVATLVAEPNDQARLVYVGDSSIGSLEDLLKAAESRDVFTTRQRNAS